MLLSSQNYQKHKPSNRERQTGSTSHNSMRTLINQLALQRLAALDTNQTRRWLSYDLYRRDFKDMYNLMVASHQYRASTPVCMHTHMHVHTTHT